MVFVIKDPILSHFNSLSTNFHGFGINLRLVPDEVTIDFKQQCSPFAPNLKFARVLISTPDPTIGALKMSSVQDMDNIFTTAPFATDGTTTTNEDTSTTTTTPSTAQRFFTDLTSLQLKTVFVFIPPQSWLDADGVLTGESALQGYANYIISGILWIRSQGVVADLVEVFPKPDNLTSEGYGFVHPKDLVVIANRIRDLSILRNVTNPQLKTLGPGLSSVLPINQDQELWTESFVFARRALDVWSIHALEHKADALLYDSGSHVARKLMESSLRKSIAQMNSINVSLEKFITSFSTRARSFIKTSYHEQSNTDTTNADSGNTDGDSQNVEPSTYVENSDGTITPHIPADSQEFNIRVIENLINILNNGFNAVFYDNLVPWSSGKGNDTACYGSDGNPRLVVDAMKKCMELMPIPGNIYRSQSINVEEDFTLKTLVMSSRADRFCFILSRPVSPDALLGRLRLTINNPLWSTQYEVYDLNITSFPEPATVTTTTSVDEYGKTVTTKSVGHGVNLSEVFMKPTMNLNYMSLFLKGLPYGGCIIFVTGKVRLKEIVTPTPTPTPTPNPPDNGGGGETPPDSRPVVMSTIMQIPVNHGEPRFTDYATGTIFYDSREKTLKTFINGTWVKCSFLDYV